MRHGRVPRVLGARAGAKAPGARPLRRRRRSGRRCVLDAAGRGRKFAREGLEDASQCVSSGAPALLVHATHRNVDAIVGIEVARKPGRQRCALHCDHISQAVRRTQAVQELIQSVDVSLVPSGVSPEEISGHDDRGFALVLVVGGRSRRFFLIVSVVVMAGYFAQRACSSCGPLHAAQSRLDWQRC